MKENKELPSNPETISETSDFDEAGEKDSMLNVGSKKQNETAASSEDETGEPSDSDNDSGFVGASRSSLDRLESEAEPEFITKAAEASKEDDRTHYSRLIEENEIFRNFKFPDNSERRHKSSSTEIYRNVLADVLKSCKSSAAEAGLSAEVLQTELNNLRETVKILPDSLLNTFAGAFRHGDCGRPLTEKPDWLDMEKFVRGQKFAREHLFGVYYAEMLSLFTMFSFEDGLKPLILTQKSSTPYTAFKRYLSTGIRVRRWYTEDPWAEETGARNDIKTVRAMHANVRKRLCTSTQEEIDKDATIANPWSPSRDLLLADFRSTCATPAPGQCPHIAVKNSPLKYKGINQGDMAATQFAFVSLTVLFPKAFGIHYATEEDLEAFCHVWRGIGYLLGIEDEYNFCRGSLEDVRQRSRDFIELWVKPNLRDVKPECEHMMRCVIEGLDYYFPGSTYETSLLYLSELLNLHLPRFYASVSYADWIKFNLMKSFLWYTIKIPGMASIFNKRLNKAMDQAVNFSPEKHAELQSRRYPFQVKEHVEPETVNEAMQ